jgi:CubicO group peptidase (beta-lactamase class C family)
MKADGTVGLSVGFIKDDFVWTKGFGFADLENKVPAKAESAYRLASITKPMTAVAVLHLVEQGKIDIDAEVQKYVPYFPKKNFPVSIFKSTLPDILTIRKGSAGKLSETGLRRCVNITNPKIRRI